MSDDALPPSKRQKASSSSSQDGTMQRLPVLEGTEPSSLAEPGNWAAGKELWLIRTPKDFDPELLNGHEITLNGDHQLDLNQDTASCANTFEWKAQASTTQQFSVLVSSSKPGRLKPGPCLRGSVCVRQSVAVPEVSIPPPAPHTSMERPHGLKQRWKPFGWREPLSVSSRKSTKKLSRKKKKKHTLTDSK